MKRILRATAEQVFGVYDTTSPAFAYYDPQDGSGTFSPMTSRPKWMLRDSLLNVPRQTGSEVQAVGGKWSGRHYWEQPTLALWPQRVNTGSTLPWPNDQRPGDLASVTLDFAYSYYDLTYKYVRYLGVKIGSGWEYSSASDPTNPFLNFSYDLIAQKSQPNAIDASSAITITDLPTPTESNIPDLPLSFYQAVFTTQGAAVDYYDRFSIRGSQIVKGFYDSKRFLNRISHNGRTVTLSAHMRLDVANDPRTRYEAITALGATTITFTKPGASSTLSFNFRSNSYLDSIGEETPMDDDAYTTISATAFLDSATGDDFTITYTA